MVKEGKKRVQITLTEDMFNRLDTYAKKMGVTKSMLCTMWVGQYVMTLDTGFECYKEQFKDKKDKNDEQLPLPL